MAMTGFICHDDYLAKTSKLTDEEVGRLFRALMRYRISHEADDIEGREALAFDFIRDDIDKAEQAYRDKCETNRRNRLLSSENKVQQQITTDDDREPSLTTDIDGDHNKNKNKNNNKNKNKTTTEYVSKHPPTVDEVREYCRERGNKVDPERFVDFYTCKGWKVGNQPMKDWRAAVRTWERNDKDNKPVKTVTAQQYEQRSYANVEDEAMRRMMELPDSEDEMDAYFSKGAI